MDLEKLRLKAKEYGHYAKFLQVEDLINKIEKYEIALKKIADPRLRDHTEPDAYTELGCVMNIANEALKD